MKTIELISRICKSFYLSYSGRDYFECEVERYKFEFCIKNNEIENIQIFEWNEDLFKYIPIKSDTNILTAIRILTKDILNN